MAQQRRAAQRSLNNEADAVNLRRERHTPERARELRPRVFSNALHLLQARDVFAMNPSAHARSKRTPRTVTTIISIGKPNARKQFLD